MISRRGFLKAVFGASVGAVTRQIGHVVEALTTRKAANVVLSACTGDMICDAKYFVIPFIPLIMPARPTKAELLFEGTIDGTLL